MRTCHATGGPITYRFRKYLQSMRDDGKWAEIIDKTSESPAAAWRPPHPKILTVRSVHSLQGTSYQSSYHGLQSHLLLRMPQSTFLECCNGRQQTGFTMSGVWRPLRSCGAMLPGGPHDARTRISSFGPLRYAKRGSSGRRREYRLVDNWRTE